MPILEIENSEEAQRRYVTYFPESAHRKEYVELVSLLSRNEDFTRVLGEVSKAIWIEYNSPQLRNAQNRFTRAILELGAKSGFQNQLNVVLTDAADPNDFGKLIRGGFLWKDSFAPGHGEFAHSYQWLAASMHFGWANSTGEIYKAIAGVKSKVPFFVKDEGPIRLRAVNLWEWLVDCTEYQPKFDQQAQLAIPEWCDRQLDLWCANSPTNSWFVQAFFAGKDPEIKPVMDPTTYEILKQRRGEGTPLAGEIRKTFQREIAHFYQAFYADLYPVRNALSNRCRNANTVTRIAKSKKTGHTESDWFISYYEQHRATTLQAKEQALTPHMVAQQLQVGFGYALDVWAYKAVIEEELRKPEYSQRTDFSTVKKAAANVLSAVLADENGSNVSKGDVGRALGTLQPIDIGKESIKINYGTQRNQEKGWRLANQADSRRSIFNKPATGDKSREQRVVVFHGEQGVINLGALG